MIGGELTSSTHFTTISLTVLALMIAAIWLASRRAERRRPTPSRRAVLAASTVTGLTFAVLTWAVAFATRVRIRRRIRACRNVVDLVLRLCARDSRGPCRPTPSRAAPGGVPPACRAHSISPRRCGLPRRVRRAARAGSGHLRHRQRRGGSHLGVPAGNPQHRRVRPDLRSARRHRGAGAAIRRRSGATFIWLFSEDVDRSCRADPARDRFPRRRRRGSRPALSGPSQDLAGFVLARHDLRRSRGTAHAAQRRDDDQLDVRQRNWRERRNFRHLPRSRARGCSWSWLDGESSQRLPYEPSDDPWPRWCRTRSWIDWQEAESERSGSDVSAVGDGVSRQERHSQRDATSEAELAQLLGVALPLLGDLDVQVEVDRRAQQLLDLRAGVGADLAQAGTLLADDDALLAVALDVDVDAYVDQRLVLGAVGAAGPSRRRRPRSSAAARRVRPRARPRG